MAKQRIRETYLDSEGCVVTVLETVKPRGRKRVRTKLPIFVCTTDYADKSNHRVAELSLSHRANGRGN